MKFIVLFLIKSYSKLLSPFFVLLFGKTCRHYPTCSQYSYQAVSRFGIKKGIVLALKRLMSCNYLSRKKYFDPIPIK